MDSGVDANSGDTLFDGLRKLTLAQDSTKEDLAVGGLTAKNLLALKKKLGINGLNPKDLVFIVSPAGYNTLLGLDETLTVDKAGANAARILTGLVPSIWGIPIIVTSAFRATDGTGVVSATAGSNTKDSILLVNMANFLLGTKRTFMVEADKDIKKQQNVVVGSSRLDFKPQEALALVQSAAIGYNF